jgi:hypothetical protein
MNKTPLSPAAAAALTRVIQQRGGEIDGRLATALINRGLVERYTWTNERRVRATASGINYYRANLKEEIR